jgi:hypothetical protein
VANLHAALDIDSAVSSLLVEAYPRFLDTEFVNGGLRELRRLHPTLAQSAVGGIREAPADASGRSGAAWRNKVKWLYDALLSVQSLSAELGPSAAFDERTRSMRD